MAQTGQAPAPAGFLKPHSGQRTSAVFWTLLMFSPRLPASTPQKAPACVLGNPHQEAGQLRLEVVAQSHRVHRDISVLLEECIDFLGNLGIELVCHDGFRVIRLSIGEEYDGVEIRTAIRRLKREEGVCAAVRLGGLDAIEQQPSISNSPWATHVEKAAVFRKYLGLIAEKHERALADGKVLQPSCHDAAGLLPTAALGHASRRVEDNGHSPQTAFQAD